MFSPTYLAGLAAVILSLQSMSVIAAPTATSLTAESVNYDSSLVPRAGGRTDYTLEEIKSMFMKNRNPPADSCYFYVGKFKDVAVARAFEQGKTSLYDVYYNANDGAKWPFNDAADPQQSYVAAGKRRKWFEDTSRAYAQVCKGKAYLVWDNVEPLTKTDANGVIIWTTIWLSDEFDAITKGETGITSVVRVDPVTFAETAYWPTPAKRGLEEDSETTAALQEKRATSITFPPFPPFPPFPFPVLPGFCNPACRAAVRLANRSSDVEGTVFTRNNDASFYVPGQCGVHFKQYQKPNPATDDYKYDITILDAVQMPIGGVSMLDVPAQQTRSIDSRLPYSLSITSGNVDSDPVSFGYAGFNFNTNGPNCKVGGYDSGARQGDCGFDC